MIATLESAPTLRREEIKLHVELITPLHACPRLRGAGNQSGRHAGAFADRTISRSRRASEDPLLLFSVLYGLWVANLVAFNSDVGSELAVQFLALAKAQNASAPLMNAHRQMGLSFLHTGNITDGRAHLEQAVR